MAVVDRIRSFVNRPVVKFAGVVLAASAVSRYGCPAAESRLLGNSPAVSSSAIASAAPTPTAPSTASQACLGLALSQADFPTYKNVTGAFSPMKLELGKQISVSATLNATADQLSGFSNWSFTIDLASNAGAKWRVLPFSANFSGNQVSATLSFSKEDILADQGTLHYLRVRATDQTGRFSYILATANNITFGAEAKPAPQPVNTVGKAKPVQSQPAQDDPCKKNPSACL